MVRRGVLAWLFGFVFSMECWAAPGEKPVIPPELPPFPCTNQQAERYWKEANRFLQEHGDSAHAPSVQHGLVMLAHLGGREDKLVEQQHALLLRYTRSVPAAHVMGSFAEAKDLRKVLRLKLDESPAVLASHTYSTAFSLALELGMAKWGAEQLLDDEKFMLEAAIAAKVAKHPAADNYVAFVLQKGKVETIQVIRTFQMPFASPAKKLIALDRLGDDAPTAAAHEVLWDELSKEDRSEIAVLRVRAVHLCRQGRIGEVNALLAEHEHDDPHLLFLQSWSSAVMGNEDPANAAVDALKKRHAKSEWTKQAVALRERTSDVQKKYDAQYELWKRAAAKLHEAKDGVEVNVRIGKDGKREHSLYVAIAPSEQVFEFHLAKGRALVGYYADERTTKFFGKNDATMLEMPTKNTFPVIRWTKSGEARAFNRREMGVYFDLKSAEKFAASGDKLVAFPLVQSTEATVETLQAAVAAGYLPCEIEQDDAMQLAKWLRPDPRTGELSTWEFRFDGDTRLRAIRMNWLETEFIRYRSDVAWRKAPPAWPTMPVESLDEVDSNTFWKILAAWTSAMEEISGEKFSGGKTDEPAVARKVSTPPPPPRK